MARHEAVRDGHAQQVGLAGVEYTVLISIGHLGLDGEVNVKTVADHLHMEPGLRHDRDAQTADDRLIEKNRPTSTAGRYRSP